MKLYWLTFDPGASPTWLDLGAGITAGGENDARALALQAFGLGLIVTNIAIIEEVGDIEQDHVAPNMEPNWFLRGVWFPTGFRSARGCDTRRAARIELAGLIAAFLSGGLGCEPDQSVVLVVVL